MDLSKDSMLPKIKEALKKIKSQHPEKFYAWRVIIRNKRSLQSLLLGVENLGLEDYQSRDVQDHSYRIEVYTRHGSPMVMGNASFLIDPLLGIEEQVEKTFQNSLMVSNKIWNLPTAVNAEYEEVLTTDPLIKSNINAAHSRLFEEASDKVSSLSKVNVNSAELFTNLQHTYFEMSTGLKGQKESSDIYFEIALEKLPLPNTQEVLKYKTAISIEDAHLSQFIDEVVEETLSITDTELPKTSSDAIILVDDEAILDLMQELTSQLDAKREYNKAPFLAPGDQVLKGDKESQSDKLTITIDPSVPVMVKSLPFTSEGMKPIKAQVIKDDCVHHQLINNRIGQYLNKKPNYIDGNIMVRLGCSTKEELLENLGPKECIEILSFSSLLINSNTLTWSSEIKLGKLWKNGKVQAMIKGGVVSGDLKENLTNFKFSNHEKRKNVAGGGFYPACGYVGPGHMLIKAGVKIAGEVK